MKASASLDHSVEDALERVASRVGGIRAVRSGSGVEFHTSSGLWVATLRPDGAGSVLHYRTGPTTPTLRHAVSQADRIRSLLS